MIARFKWHVFVGAAVYYKRFSIALFVILCSYLSACSLFISKMSNDMGEGLALAIANAKDPEMISSALPAYILMTESLIAKDPENDQIKLNAAKLYSVYLGLFDQAPSSRKRLSKHALAYTIEVACKKDQNYCNVDKQNFKEFSKNLNSVGHEEIEWLYSLAISWGQYIEAHKDDWNAIAQLAQVKAILQKITEYNSAYDKGNPILYLGIMESLIPPALGGNPDKARQYFEKSIAISGEQNLMPKVLYADNFARMMFDRELHDKLINEVLAANPEKEGFTLSNYLAQDKAAKLKQSADEYF